VRNRVLAVLLVLSTAAVAVPETPVADPEIRQGIALVDEGEYDQAILALDSAVRRLAAEKGHSTPDLAEAYFYLGVAYLGKGHETSAKARFREAVKQARDMSPSPEKFPPRVIELFEKAREEDRAETPARTAAAPKKKGGSKGLLIGGAVVLVGGGAALAASGGGSGTGSGTDSGNSNVTTRTETGAVADQQQAGFLFVASRAGTFEATVTWQNRNVGLVIDCAEEAPPYTACTGTFNRLTDTSGRYTAPVGQKQYLVLVSNYSGQAGAEPFTLTLRYP
jgi:hypothetical protein